MRSENPDEYTYFSPHFHLFFPAKRRQFDYSVAEAVQSQSGWSFHRITKGGEGSDSNVSVEDLEDLVHQLTYCFSHAGIQQKADRHELCSRLKGDIHNLYVPDDITDKILAEFCSAAPKLLGVSFANVADASCDAEVPMADDADQDDDADDPTTPDQDDNDHPLYDVFDAGGDRSTSTSESSQGGNPWPSGALDSLAGSRDGDDWAMSGSLSTASSTSAVSPSSDDSSDEAASEDAEGDADTGPTETGDSPLVDARETCGGDVVPMHEARSLLEDEQWCQQAAHVSGLRVAVAEWERRTDGDEGLPWVEDDDDPGPSTVIETD